MYAANLIAASVDIACAEGKSDVKSPCVSVCKMGTRSGLCSGCLRTLDEISGWGFMDATERRAVWAQIAQRAQAGV